MLAKSPRLIAVLAAIFLSTAACSLFSRPAPAPTAVIAAATKAVTALPTVGATAAPGSQPVQIRGSFTYTNTIPTEIYYVEQAVALVDMHGFVVRDQEWLVPVESQTLGYLSINKQQKTGDFFLQLPEQPAGVLNDVDNNGKQDTGIQIFAVSYWPNQAGGPYSEGDDPTRGWPSYLASVKTDTENKDEVTGGKLLVWSPDDQQQFPTGFGPDGLLFTPDDPAGPLPPGYSVIDLDQKPFAVLRDREPKLTLYEPRDVALKEFQNLSYTQAFEQMFAIARKEYAFNDVPGKAPDWDALYARIEPRIKEAENKKDGYAFYTALVDFTYAFKDGHVGLGGGNFDAQLFQERAGGGYGFAIRTLDNGSVTVIYLLPGGPADQAGMHVGDILTQFDGKPIAQAISQVQPLEAPQSSDFALRYQQERYLVRGPVGARAEVTFEQNGATKNVALTAVDERQSLAVTSLYRTYDPNALPVEFQILPSGLGYIRVRSNYDDLNLIIRLFERALATFQKTNAPGVIIDMRQNPGGAPLGLAGFLTEKTIDLGQLEYYSDKTGTFQAEGPRDKFLPMQEQYRFNKMALLVDQTCFSACELESYGFSQVADMRVIGMYSTAGVEAEVSRGQFKLPDGLELQIPTGRFKLPDGSIFLEGKGVQPTQKVPVTAQTVITNQDVVLQAAEDALK